MNQTLGSGIRVFNFIHIVTTWKSRCSNISRCLILSCSSPDRSKSTSVLKFWSGGAPVPVFTQALTPLSNSSLSLEVRHRRVIYQFQTVQDQSCKTTEQTSSSRITIHSCPPMDMPCKRPGDSSTTNPPLLPASPGSPRRSGSSTRLARPSTTRHRTTTMEVPMV